MLYEHRELEVNSKNFKPLREFYIKADPDKKTKREFNGGEIIIDTSFKMFEHDNVTQDGIIVYLPEDINIGDLKIQKGDHVYTHHFLCMEDNKIAVNGEVLFMQHYKDIYCVVRDGEITMTEKWNFLEPAYESEESITSPSGIMLKPKPERLPGQVIARHINKEMKAQGVKEGDVLFIDEKSECEMVVEGENYFRVGDNYILAIK